MQLIIKTFSELTTEDLFQIYKARVAVFVVEQRCAYQEVDDLDKIALHCYFEENGSIAAYLRIIPQGQLPGEVSLGRVLTIHRGQGLGRAMIKNGIQVAQHRYQARSILIEAQSYVRALYESLGFVAISEEFLLDGIPHIKMRLNLKDFQKKE